MSPQARDGRCLASGVCRLPGQEVRRTQPLAYAGPCERVVSWQGVARLLGADRMCMCAKPCSGIGPWRCGREPAWRTYALKVVAPARAGMCRTRRREEATCVLGRISLRRVSTLRVPLYRTLLPSTPLRGALVYWVFSIFAFASSVETSDGQSAALINIISQRSCVSKGETGAKVRSSCSWHIAWTMRSSLVPGLSARLSTERI